MYWRQACVDPKTFYSVPPGANHTLFQTYLLTGPSWIVKFDACSQAHHPGLVVYARVTNPGAVGYHMQLDGCSTETHFQSSVSTLVSPYAWQRAAIKPAVQYIIDNILLPPPDPHGVKLNQEQKTQQLREPARDEIKILLHSFSNGGGLTATQLLFLLREATQAPLPLVGIVMDSSPDGGSYRQTHNAIVVIQPPSKPRRALVSLVAHAALLPIWTCYVVGQQENSQLVMRGTFLDQQYVDTTSICYIYSKGDEMTDWKDVHLHAEEARAKGWYVDENMLDGGSHCAHIRSQEELYPTVVKRIWNGVRLQSKL